MDKHTWEQLMKCRRMAEEHAKQIILCDNLMMEIGYDVDGLRDNDAAGYVDMVDYGTGLFDIGEAEEFMKVKKK